MLATLVGEDLLRAVRQADGHSRSASPFTGETLGFGSREVVGLRLSINAGYCVEPSCPVCPVVTDSSSSVIWPEVGLR